MVQLGAGFADALKEASKGVDLAAMFERAFTQIGEDLYRRLRDDVIAEVRAEVQRAEAHEATDALCAALANMPAPVVHVAAPVVNPKIEVLPADVTVNTPKVDAPKVTVEPRKKIKILRDSDGKITGAETV